MWVFWMSLSMLLISVTQYSIRYYGMCWKSYLIYTVVAVFLTGWMLPLSYKSANSLLQPWFLSIGVLSLCGVIGSYYIFKDPVSTHHYVGAAIILIGCAILVKS